MTALTEIINFEIKSQLPIEFRCIQIGKLENVKSKKNFFTV
jgi:hypothetical protein